MPSSLPPKVSVIVPIYNTATYLPAALESIVRQTLCELEIILINDGSTDHSQRIIEEYATKDNRISYYHQPNQGVSVARNNGLQRATGQYIYFMDSDDLLHPDALLHCYEICEKDRLDFVCFDAESFAEEPQIATQYDYTRKEKIEEDKLWNGIELLTLELEHRIFLVSPWLHLTNHVFLKKYFQGFPTGIIHEDQLFAMQIILNATRIRYIAKPYFKRRVRSNSTMTTRFSMRNIEGYTTVCNRIEGWVKTHDEWADSIDLYLRGTLNAVIWLGHALTFLEKVETVCRFRRMRLSRYVTFKNWIVFWLKR